MKPIPILAHALLLSAAILLSPPACASSSLAFEGGGYWVDMEIGRDDRPVIARVRFHAPGDATGLVLPQAQVTVDLFDPHNKRLLLRYAGGGRVAPFALSVQGAEATLTIDSKQVQAVFDWAM